jgi:SPP1 gp7 family putative phage head morphogenesis protein
VNEVRQQIWQQEPSPLPGADEPFVMKPAAPAFGAPPPAAAPAAPPATEPPPDEAKALAASTKITFTPHVESFRARVLKQLVDEEARTISEMGKLAIDLLVGMTEEAIDVVLGAFKASAAPAHKAPPNKRKLKRDIEKKLADKFEEEWQHDVAKTLKQSVELGYDQQLEVGFNAKAKRELEALRARDAEKRRLVLAARGLDSFANISESHTERIMKQIEDGQAKGESITDIMRRVAKTLGTPGELAGRAETIARTETLTAVSVGQAAAMSNAKELFPGMKKAWLSAGDARVRDSHAALNGDVIPVDAKFDNGLSYPRDTDSGDASEVINCRCTLLLLPPGENLEIP